MVSIQNFIFCILYITISSEVTIKNFLIKFINIIDLKLMIYLIDDFDLCQGFKWCLFNILKVYTELSWFIIIKSIDKYNMKIKHCSNIYNLPLNINTKILKILFELKYLLYINILYFLINKCYLITNYIYHI